MLRTITGWRQDEAGEWVAELDCSHARHVRHSPPLWPRPWVLDPEQRAARLGTPLPCLACEPPAG